MLVLSRKKNESIVINGNIRIEVLQIKGKQIRLGITAPNSMKVLRGELPVRGTRDKLSSSESGSKSGSSEPAVGSGSQSGESSQRMVECDLRALASALHTATA